MATGPEGDWQPPPGTGFQPAPMNRPPAQPLGVGVQPGTPNIIRAFQVIISGGAGSGLFVYSPTVGPGNLFFSIAANPGTDPYGNAYLGNGLAVYGGGFTEFLGLVGAIPELQFRTNLAIEGTPSNIAGGTVGAGATQVMQFLMSGPKGNVVGGRDWAQVTMFSNSSSAANPASGQLRFIDDSGNVTEPLLWNVNGIAINNTASVPPANLTGCQIYGASGLSSHLKYVANDGNAYNTGRFTQFLTTNQTVNSVTATNISGISPVNLGIGTYHLRGRLYLTPNVAAGAAVLSWLTAGGLVVSSARIETWELAVGAAGSTVAALGNSSTANLTQTWQSTTFGAADRYVNIDGFVTVTTAGTLVPQVACTVAADTYTLKYLTYLEVLPVA